MPRPTSRPLRLLLSLAGLSLALTSCDGAGFLDDLVGGDPPAEEPPAEEPPVEEPPVEEPPVEEPPVEEPPVEEPPVEEPPVEEPPAEEPPVEEPPAEESPVTPSSRPFSADSPWNTPIEADAELHPDSAAIIDRLVSAHPGDAQDNRMDINIETYSIPRYFADADTPTTTVTCRIGGQGFTDAPGASEGARPATAEVPIPAGAEPDPQTDHHILIIDTSTNTEWGLWNASHDGDTWTCGLGAASDLDETGVRPFGAELGGAWYNAHGPRACGFPLAAGLITPEEIEAGRIEHALVFAYPRIRPGVFTEPASTSQARKQETEDQGVPCGGRIRLDPTIDLDTLDLTPAARTIARALQEYGAYAGDYSGSTNLYADNSPEAMAAWDGVLTRGLLADGGISLDQFQVLPFGQLHDGGNG